jgi:von Willebrand factor type A domain
VQFLTPYAGLVAVLVLLPLGAFMIAERRSDRVSRVLGLGGTSARARLAVAIALTVVAALLGLAVSQPTVVHRLQQHVRTDAEAWFVLDTSLSMKAAAGRHAPSRFERAQRLAERLRRKLGDVPVGLASITDRAMPHLFPTASADTFDVAIRQAIGIERPPPTDGFSVRITTLGSLARVASDNFFAPSTKRRLLVAFTDGETKPFRDRSLLTLFRQPPGVSTILVRLWNADERVYINGVVDPRYRPDPRGALYIQELAAATGGVAYNEAQFDRIVTAARKDLGSGPTRVVSREERQVELAPYAALAALAPLGFLLYRRNL